MPGGVLRNSKKRFWHSCFPLNFAKFLRTPILTEHLRWLLLNAVEVGDLKSKLIKTLSHKISVTERNIAFQRKVNFKQSQKEVIYEYILAFEGWWSIFWKVVGSGGYILAGNGWWWVVAA